MSRFLKLCVLAAGLALVAAMVPVPAQADHAWANYHWERSSNPVSLTIGDNMTGVWPPRLVEATTDWNQSAVLDLSVVAGNAKGGNCRPNNGKIEVCNDAYGFNGWLGIAQIWIDGDHITRANSRMNDSYFNSAPYNTYSWRQLVVCQEIGHDFGLGHQDEDFSTKTLPGTCMDYTDDPVGSEAPNAHDFEQLELIYEHLDTDGGGGKPCNPNSPKCNSSAPPAFDSTPTHPSDFGRLVSVSPSRGQAVFELDFGHGRKIITHVTWTLEVARQLRGE